MKTCILPSPKTTALLEKIRSKQELVDAAANRWTIENLGGTWPQTEHWSELAEEGTTSLLEEELSSWKRFAEMCASYVEEKKLPFTLASMELAFNVLPFPTD